MTWMERLPWRRGALVAADSRTEPLASRAGAAPNGSAPGAKLSDQDLEKLEQQLSTLRDNVVAFERSFGSQRKALPSEFQASAANLLHYVSLRRHDLRTIQDQLTALGLSSLGRAEAHVLAALNAVLANVSRLRGAPGREAYEALWTRDGQALAARHAEALMGAEPRGRRVRIMVTLPEQAADDYALVRALVEAGMDSARINCAHGDASEWKRMAEHVRRAAAELQRSCKIVMDVGGPKLRTAALLPGPRVLRWKPKRDELGRVVAPALVWLSAPSSTQAPPVPVDARLPVLDGWHTELRAGDRVTFKDARGKRRALKIVREAGDCRLAECSKSAYIVPETRFHADKHNKGTAGRDGGQEWGRVGELPERPRRIVVHKGDTFLLTTPDRPGGEGTPLRKKRSPQPTHIGCTLPEVFRDLRVGERILFDDGKIAGVIAAADANQASVKVTSARARGADLKADMGINLPDSVLRLDALTPKDLEDLREIVRLADIIGYSFVRRAEDVRRLQAELARLNAPNLGVLLKIENRQAFEQLPNLLLVLMRSPVAGVMIARGDLAIEIGYERLAEVQEEILWMCEAAHMPVVWATQVLETLAKEGVPSRAEITDAAMGVRAECVMLNKGPYIVDAIRALNGILARMQEHRHKKREMLRRLKMAEGTGTAL